MVKVIALTGKKGSGKSTLANSLIGHGMVANGVADKAKVENGKLYLEIDGNTGALDINDARDDYEMEDWLQNNVYPYVKVYSFAEPLKQMCISLFNIPPNCVYGSDEEKNTVMEYLRWENMPGVVDYNEAQWVQCEMCGDGEDPSCLAKRLNVIPHEPGPMTAREFMQFMGTEIMRKIYSPLWVEYLVNNIQNDQTQLALIDDMRFNNEAEGVRAAFGDSALIFGLDRSIDSGDKHISEKGIDQKYVDINIYNSKLSEQETINELFSSLKKRDWV